MRRCPRLRMLLCWIVLPLAAIGQDGGTGGAGTADAERTRRTPAMRERVYSLLAEAQACAEMDDLECAQELLAEVREMRGLNAYETAQMWNFHAYLHMGQENYREAIRAYERVLEQAEIPLGMESSTLYVLSQLHVQQEQYERALAMLDRWFAITESPGADAYYLRAQIHYQAQRYAQAVKPLTTAVRIAEEQGNTPEENWYRLLNVCYFELEDYDSTIDVLKIMIGLWPRREYFVQLSGLYGQEGRDAESLAFYEAAFEAGWLTRGHELVRLAQLYLLLDIPIKAAHLMDAGLADGRIESSETNWRLLAQAWQLAQEHEKAVPALRRAAQLSNNGELHFRLAQSHQNLYQWADCVAAAREAFRKGGLSREDQSWLILGHCLLELKEYGQARDAFSAAGRDPRSRSAAENWLQFLSSEQTRGRQLGSVAQTN